MLAIVRYRSFVLLWLGNLISGLGDGVLRLTLPFYVYGRTGSVLATSAMFIVPLVPSVLLGSLAGVFVDRWNRRRTMIGADVIRMILIVLLLLLQSHTWLWLVYGVVFLEATVSQFFRPATRALLPEVVAAEHLQEANALLATGDGLIGVVGPALGGLLLGLLGLSSVVLVDSASYLISALLLVFLRLPHEPDRPGDATPRRSWAAALTMAAFWWEWRDGLRLMIAERLPAVVLLLISASYVADGLALVVWVPYMRAVVHTNALQYGWLASVGSLGAVVSGLVLSRVSRVVRSTHLVIAAFAGLGLVFVLEAAFPVFVLVLGLNVLGALPIVALDVTLTTILQHIAPERYRGRIFGAMETSIALAVLVGMGVGGLLGGVLDVRVLLALAGAIDLGFGVVAGLALRERRDA